LDLIELFGGQCRDERLELRIEPEDERLVRAFLDRRGITAQDTLLAVNPGAGAPQRRWPTACFSELADWLITEYRAKIVLIGGPGEEWLGKEIKNQTGGDLIDAIGKFSLRQTGALLKYCRLFVGNDSGPMHLAAAAGRPVIEISCFPQGGPESHANSPARFGPWGTPFLALQPANLLPPCTSTCTASEPHCIRLVSIQRVKQAVADCLNHWNR